MSKQKNLSAKSPKKNPLQKNQTKVPVENNAPEDVPPRKDGFKLSGDFLTTNQGLRLSDNHNSLKAGVRGPSLLEDFVLREKITSFDHERIPERVVHARGAGAFGVFECTKSMKKFTSAGFLSEVGKKTPVLTRFSTVAGSRGSADTARDVRGFSAKFYTDEGNYDFVGNNIPVFFIQDAMKFPDLIHAVKPEPNNEIPQASSAHDTFWDFISLMPESTHMIFWHLSDRAIPRSFRMMQGFGVHTFRFVNAQGEGTFVKFHWKPKLGIHGLVWEEAQLIAGMDPDFHRRDLFEAIDSGAFPVWEFGVQLIPEADEHKYSFDLLDPTKLVPEELVPVTIMGTLTLNRNPENYFSEIEQAVFHPGHLVPGIDLTNDPLLQGRLFSYTDTQITRLGGPNFHELPVNRPLAGVNNHQRDGFGRQSIPTGRVAYEPNSLGGGCPFHAPEKMKSYVHFAERMEGHKVRARSESFGDHFSQAKLFYDSQTKVEQEHIEKAFTFELSKVETAAVRERMIQTVMMVDEALATKIATNLGMKAPKSGVEQPNPANPENSPVPPNRSTEIAQQDDAEANPQGKRVPLPAKSKALSMVLSSGPSVETRKVALLVNSQTKRIDIETAKKAIEAAGAVAELVGPNLELKIAHNETLQVDKILTSTPSVVYDGVIVMATTEGFANPEDVANAFKFTAQAFKHCKTIGSTGEGFALLSGSTMAMVEKKVPGIVNSGKGGTKEMMSGFLQELSKHRHWDRSDMVKAFPA